MPRAGDRVLIGNTGVYTTCYSDRPLRRSGRETAVKTVSPSKVARATPTGPAASKSSLLADSNFTLRDGQSTGSRAHCRRSVRTSAWFWSRQWPSRSEHSVPTLGAGPDQHHLFGHPWRSMLSIALQPHGFIGRGPGSAQLAPHARDLPGTGRRSTGSRALPDRR
jgi:hypothetical protein